MPASVLTLLAVASFGVANISLMRGARTSPMWVAVLLSVFSGVPFFLVVAGVSGDLRAISLGATLLFALAGLIHFVVGRSLMFAAIGMLGASRAILFISLTPVISLVAAVLLLDETLAPLAVFGAALTISGPLAARPPASQVEGERAPRWSRGMSLALLGSFCWGISPIVIKEALDRSDAAVTGTLISYLAAAACLGVWSVLNDGVEPFRKLDRNALLWFVVAAITSHIAQLLIFVALGRGDVSVVVVLQQLTPIVVTGLSFTVNRRLELFSPSVAVGGVLAVVGAVLVVSAA